VCCWNGNLVNALTDRLRELAAQLIHIDADRIRRTLANGAGGRARVPRAVFGVAPNMIKELT